MSNNLPERLRGMFDMGVPSGDTFNHLTPAGFRLLREAHDQISATRKTLEEFVEFVEASDNREGYCMCGDPMDAHGFHSNHSPVDMGTYRADGLIEKAKALIGKDVFG